MIRRLVRKVAARWVGRDAKPEPEPEPEFRFEVKPEPDLETSYDGPAVVIYFKRGCPYTRAAFSLLQEREVEHTAIDVTTDEATRGWLRTVTGQRTTPQVFIEGKSIGGYDELRELDLDGGLARFVGTA